MKCPSCQRELTQFGQDECADCANNLAPATAISSAAPVRCAATGSAALAWTAEPPRSAGWWWHKGWPLKCLRVYKCQKRGDTQKRLYVEGSGDQIYSENMRGDKTVEEFGGWWWPEVVKPPGAETPPNEKLSDGGRKL